MTELAPGAITVADLYHELVGMRSDMGRVLARIEVFENINKGADIIHTDHENRLRLLEAFRWKIAGMCLLGGGLAGTAAAWIGLAVAHR